MLAFFATDSIRSTSQHPRQTLFETRDAPPARDTDGAFYRFLHGSDDPSTLASMDEQTKSRIRELMFYVVPDPGEEITDDVLARSESVDYNEGERLKAEFRSLIEGMTDQPEVRQTVLAALDDMKASSNEVPVHGNDTEWLNVQDVMGRRIRKALARLL